MALNKSKIKAMIKSFKSKALMLCWINDDCCKLPSSLTTKIRRMLKRIDDAQLVPDDLGHYDIHLLKGNYKGYWSLKVNGNYRIIFRFEDGKAFDVDYIDYH